MAAVGDMQHPVALAIEAIARSAKPFERAVAGTADDERRERTWIPLQPVSAQRLEELDGDVLGDVIGGIVVDELAGGPSGDGEDAGEKRFLGGEVQIGGVLHGALGDARVGSSLRRGGST